MATKVLALVTMVTIFCGSVGAQTYPDLPQAESVPITLQLETSTLTALFSAAKGFVDLVFVPFAQMQDYVRIFLTTEDFVGSLSSNWRQILQAQAGAIACIFFGALFIVFVLFGGIFTCACRTCADSCGGEKMQTQKRARSNWKNCFTLSLFVLAVLVFVPGIIVLQTNNWINTVMADIPDQASNLLQNGINYVDSITVQLDAVVNQYLVMSSSVLAKVANMSALLGTPILTQVSAIQSPVLTTVTSFGSNIGMLSDDVDAYEALRSNVTWETSNYEDLLTEFKSRYAVALSTPAGACLGSSACTSANAIIQSVDANLDTFGTPDDMSTQQTELQSHLTTCRTVYATLEPNINTAMNTLISSAITPAIIANTTANMQVSLDTTQNTINTTMSSLDVFINFRQYLVQTQQTIRSFMTTYSNTYDRYRWIAGVILGAFIMLISACFLLGIFFGQFCVSEGTAPTERGCLANMGGVLLMSGAGLSVMFSWLLMILVTITFLVGGVSERYVCQTIESPYEMLQFVDNNIPLNFSVPSVAVTSSLTSILNSCQNNAPITTTFGLSHLVNVSSITAQLQGDISATTIDIPVTTGTTEQINNTALRNCLTQYRATGAYTGGPITIINGSYPSMTVSAILLGTIAFQVPSSLTATVQNAASELQDLEIILREFQSKLDNMNSAARSYNARRQNVANQEVYISTNAPLADAQVSSDLPNIVSTSVSQYLTSLVDDATAYLLWFAAQANTNIGACLPVYTMYDGLHRFICDYFVDSLNGFWFSLGWSIFFMIPAAILALKLAKFYRKMDMTDELPPKPTGVQIMGPGAANPKKSTQGKNLLQKPHNKVGPSP